MRGEEVKGFFDIHVQDFRDVLPLESHLKGLMVVSRSMAILTLDIDIREEVHFHPFHSAPFAYLASSSPRIEAESPRSISALHRFMARGEGLPDMSEDSGIGRDIRVGSPADGGLIHDDDLVQILGSADALHLPDAMDRRMEGIEEMIGEDIEDEG